MQKNPRKARYTCTKEYRAQKGSKPKEGVETDVPQEAAPSAGGANDLTGEHTESAGTMMVWEISDSDCECQETPAHEG